jgi:hypothetical protein
MWTNYSNLHEPIDKILTMKKLTSSGVNADIQDYIAKVQEFKKHLKFLERVTENRLESKAEIDLPKNVNAYHVESNVIGRKDDGTWILYINLLCECTDSGRQCRFEFFCV